MEEKEVNVDNLVELNEENVTEFLRELPPYEVRKILCNVYGVPSYLDDQALAEALIPVMTAR